MRIFETRSRFAVVAGVIAIGTATPSQNLGQRTHIGPNVQISRPNSAAPHAESYASADPTNPKVLLTCSMFNPVSDLNVESGVVMYRTLNGGQEWKEVFRVIPASDPVCVFGPDHVAYLVVLFNGPERATRVFKSLDSGETWAAAYDLAYGDRETVIVDKSPGGRGHLFIAEYAPLTSYTSERGRMTAVWFSPDQAKSFRLAGAIGPSPPVPIVGAGDVFADGEAIVPIVHPNPGAEGQGLHELVPIRVSSGSIVVATADSKSADTAVRKVASWYSCGASEAWPPMPNLAIDHSKGPFAQRVYIAWADARSGSCRILLSASSDHGKTWSEPIQVDDAEFSLPESAKAAFKPMLAVNDDGILAAYWSDRRGSGSSWSFAPRFAASFDGGETFTSSVALSASRMAVNEGSDFKLHFSHQGHLLVGGVSHAGGNGGETSGFAVTSDGSFYPVWVENRTGQSQLWTSRISVEGRAVPNGSPELADFVETGTPTVLDTMRGIVPTAPSLEIVASVARPADHSISLRARVFNGTSAKIDAPVLLRSISLRSPYGPMRPANPTNGIKGPGAIWDLSEALPKDGLGPGERSRTFTLEFELPASAWPLRIINPDIPETFGFQGDLRILMKRPAR